MVVVNVAAADGDGGDNDGGAMTPARDLDDYDSGKWGA
jgi:hypothetical protein